MKFVTAEDALARMEALCARSEQCTADIAGKLLKMKIHPADADRIIARLKELRFLDDSRFARAFCHDKVAFAGWGRHKITSALRAKRIDSQLIAEALDSVDEDLYRTRAAEVLASKARQLGDAILTREGTVKLLRFGLSRGFDYPLVAEIARTLRQNYGNAD